MHRGLLAVVITALAVVIMVVIVTLLVDQRTARESSQSFDSGRGWSIIVDRRDGWGYVDFRVRLRRTAPLSIQHPNSGTLIPWGSAYVENVKWLSEKEVKISGLSRSGSAHYVRAWGEIVVHYDMR